MARLPASLADGALELIRARGEHRRALLTLTGEQLEELDEALDRHRCNELWSTLLALEWMFKEGVRRGWLLGPA